MPSFKVYGNRPDDGPSPIEAKAVQDDLDEKHPTWQLEMVCTEQETVYTSNTAPASELGKALKDAFPPNYTVVEIPS
jgi:hypothetical protein